MKQEQECPSARNALGLVSLAMAARKAVWFARKVASRESYHPLLTYPWFVVKVLVCRLRYARTRRRLKAKVARGEKVRVVFLSMDTAKWKCQSIYDEMSGSRLFDPVVALTMTDEDEGHTAQDVDRRNAESRRFYESHGCKVVVACDSVTGHAVSLDALEADIVFFQVPWGNLRGQTVWDVSRYALTCYMPYGVEWGGWKSRKSRFDFHHIAGFQCLMWKNFTWSERHARLLYGGQFPWEWAGLQHGCGHSSLDVYTLQGERNRVPGEAVIYAPHFSFTWNGHAPIMNFSTFHWSGRAILRYAKDHPEIKWAFKPHPKLRERLSEIGFMTKEEVDQYYHDWETLGASCYDGDYARMFFESRAMVTDCGSFLFEYMAVGKPLIRLIPDNIKVAPCEAARQVVDSCYNCHGPDEMFAAFKTVLEEGRDPKRRQREEACREARLLGNYAAGGMMTLLEKELSNG